LPAPNEFVQPDIAQPPSEVFITEYASSVPTPPNALLHCIAPAEVSLSRYAFCPGTPYDLVCPAAMNPPFDVCTTECAKSSNGPPALHLNCACIVLKIPANINTQLSKTALKKVADDLVFNIEFNFLLSLSLIINK
jgi:hypothetical protein